MLWDVVFVLIALTLCAAGWTSGIINAWRGPFAIIAATLITQHYYIDFSTWIVQQLRTQPEAAVALGYVTMWIASEIIVEILLHLIPLSRKHKPIIINRILGACLGFVKTVLIFLFPMMVLQIPITVPTPPKEQIPINFLMVSGVNDSVSISVFRTMAKNLMPTIGEFVVSKKKPSFVPNFMKNNDEDNSVSKEILKHLNKQKPTDNSDSDSSSYE